MFRRRHQANGDLPTTMGNTSSSSSASPFSFGSNGKGKSGSMFGSSSSANDGSARSIHLQSPVVQKWKQSSLSVKLSYTISLIAFLTVVFGWRTLSYHSARVNFDCSTTECNILVRGVGRTKPIRLTIPRQQIVGAYAAKVNKSGQVVNHKVNINEEWKYEPARSKKKKYNSNNYKGPDKDGNYLTYIVELKNRDPNQPADAAKDPDNLKEQLPKDREPMDDDGWKNRSVDQADSVDLAPILSFCQPSVDDNGANAEHKYHIVMRQHGIVQTRRRVRNMIQKIDSFAKKRRHKLSVKESTSPDWRGVLMMVLGGVVFLLSLLLGLFWEDEEAQARQPSGGPGARRLQKQQQHQQQLQKKVNPYQRTTPARYEVSTQPKKPVSKPTSSVGRSIKRRN